MPTQSVEANGMLEPMEINVCEPCNLFWFDKLESVRLTPKSVIELFQFIGKAGAARRTIARGNRGDRPGDGDPRDRPLFRIR